MLIDEASSWLITLRSAYPRPNISTRKRKVIAMRAITNPNRFALINRFYHQFIASNNVTVSGLFRNHQPRRALRTARSSSRLSRRRRVRFARGTQEAEAKRDCLIIRSRTVVGEGRRVRRPFLFAEKSMHDGEHLGSHRVGSLCCCPYPLLPSRRADSAGAAPSLAWQRTL